MCLNLKYLSQNLVKFYMLGVFWKRQNNFKSVPGFENWTRFVGEIEQNKICNSFCQYCILLSLTFEEEWKFVFQHLKSIVPHLQDPNYSIMFVYINFCHFHSLFIIEPKATWTIANKDITSDLSYLAQTACWPQNCIICLLWSPVSHLVSRLFSM